MGAIADQVEAVAAQFAIAGEFCGARPYGTGHINDTFLCTYREQGQGRRYVIQHINHFVFKQPRQLMENMARVTAHLRAKLVAAGRDAERETLAIVPTTAGNTLHVGADGNFWRCCRFVENARSCDVVTDDKQAFQAARAFGRFQKLLTDLPAPRLHETIVDFHHTPKRFATFEATVRADAKGRAATCRPEIEFALARHAMVSRVIEAMRDGRVPERITHNDTKINNVLMDNETNEGICVIDLDTVMPGSVLFDFGDQVRSTAGDFAENEKDLSKVGLNLPRFEALVAGYLAEAGDFLTPTEVALLAFAGPLLTFECGIRFLGDYLQGDPYFKIHYPEENLDRARTQFRFVADMEQQMAGMEAIVRRHAPAAAVAGR